MSTTRDKQRNSDLFLPTLLDRLSETDLKPAGSGMQLSRSAYHKTVLRDLSWLLNCASIDASLDLESYPHVRASVMNFGIPPLAGTRFSDVDLEEIAAGIHRAILRFEPRILPDSLKVTVVHDPQAESHNQVSFQIRAAFWFEPYPLELAIRAQWDVENGTMELKEGG